MTITLTPETENRLLQQAQRIGEDVNRLAYTLIANGLPQDDFEDDSDALSEAEIADMQAGIGRGLDAAAAGRVKSQAQAIAEARQRHGFISTWASGAGVSLP